MSADDGVGALDLDHSPRLLDRDRRVGVRVAQHELHGLAKDATCLVDVLDRQEEAVTHLDADLGEAAGEVSEEPNLERPQLRRAVFLLPQLVLDGLATARIARKRVSCLAVTTERQPGSRQHGEGDEGQGTPRRSLFADRAPGYRGRAGNVG